MEIMRPEARLCFNALLKKHMLLFTMPHIRGFILKMFFFFFLKGYFMHLKFLCWEAFHRLSQWGLKAIWFKNPYPTPFLAKPLIPKETYVVFVFVFGSGTRLQALRPQPGTEPKPWQWKPRILTMKPSANIHVLNVLNKIFVMKLICSFEWHKSLCFPTSTIDQWSKRRTQ